MRAYKNKEKLLPYGAFVQGVIFKMLQQMHTLYLLGMSNFHNNCMFGYSYTHSAVRVS